MAQTGEGKLNTVIGWQCGGTSRRRETEHSYWLAVWWYKQVTDKETQLLLGYDMAQTGDGKLNTVTV
jgi:hypothetical protein